jgi:hypothetical protein
MSTALAGAVLERLICRLPRRLSAEETERFLAIPACIAVTNAAQTTLAFGVSCVQDIERVMRDLGLALGNSPPPHREFFALVCDRDRALTDRGEPRGPILLETYLDHHATRSNAADWARRLAGRYGPCRIARVVVDELPLQ